MFAHSKRGGAGKQAQQQPEADSEGVDMDFGDDYDGEKESKKKDTGSAKKSKASAILDGGGAADDDDDGADSSGKAKRGLKKKKDVSWDEKDANAAVAKRMAHKQAFLKNPRHVKPPPANQLDSAVDAAATAGGAAGASKSRATASQADNESESWETVSATGTVKSQGQKSAGG